MSQMKTIRAAITRFDTMCQDYAFVGTSHPDDREAIEAKYIRSRLALERLIEKALEVAKQ